MINNSSEFPFWNIREIEETNESAEPSKDEPPVPKVLKREGRGEFWHYYSGLMPSYEPENIDDVDPLQNVVSISSEPSFISQRQLFTYPVNTDKIEAVVCLLIMAYNSGNHVHYTHAGEYLAASLEYTLMPLDQSIRYAKLHRLILAIRNGKTKEVIEWCIHEYPRTMEYLADEGHESFCAGLTSAYKCRWIRLKRQNPIVSRIEVE